MSRAEAAFSGLMEKIDYEYTSKSDLREIARQLAVVCATQAHLLQKPQEPVVPVEPTVVPVVE